MDFSSKETMKRVFDYFILGVLEMHFKRAIKKKSFK
jgi:hypothetical protein